MQEPLFRRVAAEHPHWRGVLLLSTVSDSLIHESHGTRGTYRLSPGALHVAWHDFPAEDFIEIDGRYIHRSLLPPTTDPATADAGGSDPPRWLDTIQVVSLRRTTDRRERFETLNPGLEFAFFDAIDGSSIDRAEFFSSPLAREPVPYSAGAIGCALSHLALWERAVNDQVAITIVEDDAILRQDFQARSRALIARLPVDWDLIMWGWNFDSILSVNAMPGVSSTVIMCDQTMMRQSLERFRSQLLEPQALPLDKCFGTCAYSISPAGGQKFRQGCFPLRNEPVYFPALRRVRPNDGIDVAMNRLYPATRSYVAFPPLVVTPNNNAESLTLERRQ